MSDFYETLFKGNVFKELVKVVLEKSSYTVIPYGYENPFANVKNKLNMKLEDCSPTVRRIRHSPDLLVFDEEKKDAKLVEIKMSSYQTPPIKRINYYREYWNDAILVYVIPFENVFYAQEISKLGIKERYDPNTDFRKIQELFEKIHPNDLQKYGEIAKYLISAMKKTDNRDTDQ